MHRPLLLAPMIAALLSACASPSSSNPAADATGSRPQAAARATSPTRMQPADRRALLDYHNKVRADVGVGPLRWDSGLAAFAQQWADHLAASGCRMQHRQPNDYGENLFQGTAGYYTAVDAAKAWESEKRDYHGGAIKEKNEKPVGHYTQMVWRDTKKVGCGVAMCDGTVMIACNYDPPGNYLGKKPY